MPLIDMHDYSAAARRYWWIVTALGAAALAISVRQVLQLDPQAQFVTLAGALLAALVGLFPVRVLGTRVGIAGAEIIVFFMLILLGPGAAALAAAFEGVSAATMQSKRWTSRIFTPAMAAITLQVLGSAFESARDVLSAGMIPQAALFVAVVPTAALCYFVSSALAAVLFALKRGARVTTVLWATKSWMMYLWYIASASIAGLLYLSFEKFGVFALLAGVPIVALFLTTMHLLTRLELANRYKGEFLAHMSHELRTPLNCIIGGSQILREGVVGPLNERQAQWAADIHESGNHLLTLINDILDLSKIEAGRMELQTAALDLPDAIAHALILVKDRAFRHGIRLSSDIAPDVGEVKADARKLKQILLNLLSNAVKFTPDGGAVTVSARRVAGGFEITVADTGVGISPADQETIFEAFRQSGNNFHRDEGTGLGLALARDLTQLHGGALRLESRLGSGSTFTIFLPATHTG